MSDPYADIAKPVDPQAFGPAAFTDTGQPGTVQQQAAYAAMHARGAYDPAAPKGSARNPYGLRDGDQPPAGAYFIDQGGQMHAPADPYAGIAQHAEPLPIDMARSLGTGLERGATAMAAAPGDARDAMAKAATDSGLPLQQMDKFGSFLSQASLPAQLAMTLLHASPNSQALQGARQQLTGADYQPQSTPGRVLESVGEYAPAMTVGPGGIATKAVASVLGGAGSELAGEQFHNNPVARFVGGGLGLALGHGVGAVARSPQQLIADAMPGLSPDAQQRALAIMRDGEARGIHVPFSEAVQQATNGGTGFGWMQRVTESTPQGQRELSPLFADRPNQVRAAVMAHADTLAPPTDQPSMIGRQAQAAAQGALNGVRQDINAEAKPYYDALTAQDMDPAQYAALTADPSYAKALRTVRMNSELNGPIKDLPDNSLAVVNLVKQHLGTMADQAAGTALNPGDRYLAALRSGAKGSADEAARAASPDYATANNLEAANRSAFLEPLEAGPLGKIAGTPEVPAQTAALYPSKPLEGSPAETASALRAMNGVDPFVAPDLTRQHIVNSFNELGQDNMGGPNQWGGAKWVAGIMGNPEQRAALQAGYGELPGGDAKTADLKQLADTLRATGYRLGPGSPTAEKTAGLGALHATKLGSVLREGLNPLEWGEGLGKLANAAAYRARMNSMVGFLKMNPDEMQALLARMHGREPTPQSFAAQLMLQAPAANNPP